MKLNVPVIGQRNPQWSTHSLGSSTNTIGADGCALTCLTMLMQYYKHAIDVPTLNNWLTLNEGYSEEDLIIWDSIMRLANDIDFIGIVNCGTVAAPIDKINQEVQNGHPVIIGVDFNHNPQATSPDHYVIIVGIMDDGTYIINDPWYSDQVFLTGRYAVNGMSQAEAILEVIFYEGSSTDFVVEEPKPNQPNISETQVGSEVSNEGTAPAAPEPTQPLIESTPTPDQTTPITDNTDKNTAVAPEIPSNSPSSPQVDELNVLFNDLQTLLTKILKILLIKILA